VCAEKPSPRRRPEGVGLGIKEAHLFEGRYQTRRGLSRTEKGCFWLRAFYPTLPSPYKGEGVFFHSLAL
jgi:hypothetical protein